MDKSEQAPWRRSGTSLWQCKSKDKGVTAEVRQIDTNRYLWSVSDYGGDYTGTSTRCTDAMRAAERAMGYERR